MSQRVGRLVIAGGRSPQELRGPHLQLKHKRRQRLGPGGFWGGLRNSGVLIVREYYYLGSILGVPDFRKPTPHINVHMCIANEQTGLGRALCF